MAQNVWVTPGSTYGSSQDWSTTPFVTDFLDPQMPQGVFLSYLTSQGLGDFGRQSQFAQGLYGKSTAGWQAAKRQNPTLTYLPYLQQQFGNGGFTNLYNSLSEAQRGEQGLWRNFSGRARFQGRG